MIVKQDSLADKDNLGIPSKKKFHMEGHCPNRMLPPTPFKSRDNNRRDIFWVLDPPPPFKSREIC